MTTDNKIIVYLQSEVHSYHLHSIRYLISYYGFNVIVVHWDHGKHNSYEPPLIEGCDFYGKSAFKNRDALYEFLNNKPIQLVRASGWMDKDYVMICRKLKRNNMATTVVCSDTQWKNSIRQRLGSLIYSKFLRDSFHKIMVAGVYQFEYARKLGFSKTNIIFGNLSANTEAFRISEPLKSYKRRILYVGRLSQEKGVQELLAAWALITEKNDYKLHIIGNGPIADSLSFGADTIWEDYIPNDMIPKIMQESTFIVIPSLSEQWGVVMQEAALSGLPMVSSIEVGAMPTFFIENFNGFSYQPGEVLQLKAALQKMICLSAEELWEMRLNSIMLGSRITTRTSCASLLSAMKS